MTRSLALSEWELTRAVALSVPERDELRRLNPDLAITPSPGLADCFDLTPGSVVGAISIDSLAVTIRPKLPIVRLLFLISYALDVAHWQETPFDFREGQSLLEAIVPGFVFHLQRVFRRGLLQGYQTAEDALTTVRGRLRFDDQLRRRFGLFPPAEVRYDEYTQDIELNRLLKAAIHRLGQLKLRSARSLNDLRRCSAPLTEVSLAQYDPGAVPVVAYTRLTEHYRPAVELARLILRSAAFDVRHGSVGASAFLIDMNQVFERFVYVALREALGLSEASFPRGAAGKRLSLDEAGRVVLRPDLSWWEAGRCVFVGDAKYKRVDATGVKDHDLYQLPAYIVVTDLPGGMLIYAAGGAEPVTHRVRFVRRTIDVVSLDLDQEPENIFRRVKDIAARLLELREQAVDTRKRSQFQRQP